MAITPPRPIVTKRIPDKRSGKLIVSNMRAAFICGQWLVIIDNIANVTRASTINNIPPIDSHFQAMAIFTRNIKPGSAVCSNDPIKSNPISLPETMPNNNHQTAADKPTIKPALRNRFRRLFLTVSITIPLHLNTKI